MHKQGIQAALGCDSDLSQHEGNSSVHLHWVSGSVEQDVDPGNVKTRDFQNLATGFGNSQDSGVLRCSEGKHFQRVNEEGPGPFRREGGAGTWDLEIAGASQSTWPGTIQEEM